MGESREQHIGRILGNVAPSMLLCSLSEAVCFFLGEWGCGSGVRGARWAVAGRGLQAGNEGHW